MSQVVAKIVRKVSRELYKPLKVFFFHQVSSKFIEGKDKESIFSSLDQFEKNIRYLMQRYHLVSLTEAKELFRQKKWRGERYAVITFDDGYTNILEALELLKALNIPATVFVNSKYVFERTVGVINLATLVRSSLPNELSAEQKQLVLQLCDHELQDGYKEKWDRLMANLPELPKVLSDLYLTPNQLEDLDKDLFTIGMHGYEHYNSLQLTDDEFRENFEKDQALMSNYPNYIPFFCFPYGYAREGQLELLRKSGITPVLCSGGDNYSVEKVIYRDCLDGVKLR